MSSAGGWFEDPTGRFAQRFFDGANWSEQVVGANGSVFVDVLPPGATIDPPPATVGQTRDTDGTPDRDATPGADGTAEQREPPTDVGAPPPRPRAAAAAAATLPPNVNRPIRYARPDRRRAGRPDSTPDWEQASIVTAELPAIDEPTYVLRRLDESPEHQSTADSGRPDADPVTTARLDQLLPGLVVAVLGVICVLLSLLALDWASSGGTTFLDIGRHVSAGDDALVHAYTAWLAWVLLVLTLAAVALAGRPAPRWRSGSSVPRIAGSALAGVAALLQTIVITHVFRGPASPQFGAWVGVAGYLVVVGGLTLGTSRRG